MGVTLTPVKGDPFAQPQPQNKVTLTPVDGDPFAPPPTLAHRIGSAVSGALHGVVHAAESDPNLAPAVAGARGVVQTVASGPFRRAAGRGVIPSLAGAGGFGPGFAIGGTITAPAEVIPVAGQVINLLGALAGGVVGAYGASTLAGKVQDKAIAALPVNAQRILGQDAATRQADEAQHPIQSFAGSLAPMLLTMRPGFSATKAAPNASRLTRVLSHPLGGSAVGASLGGTQEAAREYVSGEDLSPEKIALSTAAGAVLNRPTALGSKLFEAGGNAAVRGMQATARGAGSMFRGDPTAARQGFDINSTATELPPEPTRLLPAPANDVPPARPTAGEPVAPEAGPAAPAGGITLTPVKGDPFTGPVEPVAHGEPAGVPAGEGAGDTAPVPVAPEPAAASQAEPAAPLPQTAQPSAPQPLADGEKYVRTPAGNKVRTRMEVVDASTLNKATGSLQNRDRSRDTTTLQVQDIISKFDPELLGDDPSSDRGAPIVDEGDTVLSGNGRMLALNRVFDEHPEKAAAYRQFIEAQGHTTEGIERPVLVRRVTQPLNGDEKRQFVVESNKDNKLTLSASEKARSDADYIKPEMLARYAGGDLNTGANTGFVEGFTKQLTAGELGDMLDSNRKLTPAGVQRIENAIVAHAYGKPQMLERMMESSNNDIRSITGSLASVAPRWARMRDAVKSGEIDPKFDVTDDLMLAAERVAEAKRKDEKPADILSQVDAFNPMSAPQAELIRAFYNKDMTRAASRKAVTDFLHDYVEAAEAEKAADGLFGKEEPRNPDALLKELLAKRDNPNGEDLFDAPTKESIGHDASGAPHGHEDGDQIALGEAQEQARPAEKGSAGGGSDGAQVGNARGAHGSQSGSGASGANHGDAEALDVPAAGTGADRGGYQPSFEEASFTDRQSAYSSAIQALGMEEEKFNLLPPQRKAKLLIDALDRLTGIKVTVAPDMPLQYAVDQMLDAHQTLQGMAEVLGVAPRALSLGGTLKLKLLKGANFLGVYNHAKAEIGLPKRSNSFSHEWGHALDYYLLDRFGAGMFRGLSGMVRDEGADFTPTSVREAFVNLMNSLFFDGAEIAAKVMRLGQQIEATKSPKQKAALQKQVDNILSGRSRAKEKSRYWQGANAMNKAGGDGDYWTRPTEMLARAFEAWTSFKLANAGFGSEFVGKGDSNYLSDSERRFQLTFPKGDERARIFDAFQKLIDTLNVEQAIESAPGSGPTLEAASGFNDVATPEMEREAAASRRRTKRSLSPLAADLESVATWFHNRKVDAEESDRRASDPVKLLSKINNARSIAFSAAADGVKMVATRWGSKAAQKIHDQFANDLGGTRFVDRTWTDAVDMAVNKALNPVFNEVDRIGGKGWVFKKLTREQNDALSKLLLGKDVADDMGLAPLASAMRKAFNDLWYMQRNAGLDIGYVNDAGYINRQIDRELVAGNPDGFTEQARQVYEAVFDRDIGDDAESIAANPEKAEAFADIAKRLGVDGYKELRKALREEGEGREPADIIAEMLDEVRAGFAAVKAAEYRDAILHQETFADYSATSSLPSSEKKRALPAEADELLRDFYNPSPISSLTHYAHNAVQRAEWNRRFGRPAGAKKTAPTIAQKLDEQMAAEGVPAGDRRLVWELVDKMSGRYKRTGFLANPAVTGALAALRVKGTLAMMGRAVTLSFFEPASLGIVTGNPFHGAVAVAKTWANIIHKGSREEVMEWARAQGFIKHHLLEQFQAMDRFGTTSDTPSRLDRLPAAMFRNTGLTFLTHASDAAIVDVGRRGIINEMAHRIARGGARGKEAANFARELGIRDPDAFARQIVDMNNALPSDEWLAGPEGFDYLTALQRLSRYSIQKPAPAELAPLGRNPLASYATYSITAFIQASYRNLFKRNIIKGFRLLKEGEYEMLGRYVIGTLLSVATLYGLQFLSSVLREYLFNPDRQKQWEKDGDWGAKNAALAATRTFSFAWGDTLLNSTAGLKYNRDLSYLPLGAYAGNDAQNLSKIAKALPLPSMQTPFLNPPGQSRKTNSGEYNAITGAYNFAIAPAISAGIQAAPGGGPVSTVLSGLATSTATGPVAAERVAKAIVGPKDGSIGPDGKKVKSGPTGYDKLLNSAFGEVKRKKKGE